MTEQWLIDGYNLLYALQQTPEKSLPREELLSRVAEFASFKKTRILLVLDGTGDEGELDGWRTDCFEAVFSKKMPADTYIEQYLFEHRQSRQISVVTNDRAIANLARGGGARVLSTGVFWDLLTDCKKESSEILRIKKTREHGFNRPFDEKLKDL